MIDFVGSSPIRSTIYILGERPGKNTDPSRPLYPHNTTGAAARLIRLLSLTREDYIRYTTRLNAANSTESTSSVESRLRVESFLLEAGHKPVLVLGREACKALPTKYRKIEFGQIIDNVLCIPHTSGISRFWNDKEKALSIQNITRDFIASYEFNNKTNM